MHQIQFEFCDELGISNKLPPELAASAGPPYGIQMSHEATGAWIRAREEGTSELEKKVYAMLVTRIFLKLGPLSYIKLGRFKKFVI
jgi:hypothetical protein